MDKRRAARSASGVGAPDTPSLTMAERLVAAAASLLDAGGEGAVTLRAVGQAVGVSHNAPYKHFDDRGALLAAVAIRDFRMLTDEFAKVRRTRRQPLAKVEQALMSFVSYGRQYPARYRLLFSDPDIAERGDELEAAAMRSFSEFAAIVQACQDAGDFPSVPNAELTGLIYASVHGLIDLQAGGRMRTEKGFTGVDESVHLLLTLLARAAPTRLGDDGGGDSRGLPGPGT